MPSGEYYLCSGRGQCVQDTFGNYSCVCNPGYTGSKCQLGDCVPPCDARSTCQLPTPTSLQKQCVCNRDTVYGLNQTYPNLCNVDLCKVRNILTRPNVNGTACECIDPLFTFASGCVTQNCKYDTSSGQICGPAHVSDAINGACKVPYDYVFFPDSYARTGTVRRGKECDRYEKRCFDGTCLCGRGYRQNATTGLCDRVCNPDHTVAVIDCLGTEATGCIRTGYPSLTDPTHTTFKCQCDPAYSGSLYCDTLRCMHGGVSSSDGKRCTCPFPWTGDVCTDDLCVNGVANFVNNTCDCLFGWSGSRCTENMCKNGGKPDYNTLGCRCPSQWGGPTCAELTCKFNSYWDQLTKTCKCSPGYAGERCDEPVCGDNVLPNADGTCTCNENFMDPLCLYRWCGPYGSVFPGTRDCICRPLTGAVLDPLTHNCTLPVCGAHSSWSIDQQECVCDVGFVKNMSEPLQPCVHYECSEHGIFNSYAGGCVCDSGWFGTYCELDVTAFLQPIIRQPILLPNGVIVSPIPEQPEQVLPGPPGAIVQVVLRDPYPLPISYEEDAVTAITKFIPGYTILWEDLDDLVKDHAGLPAALDPTNIEVKTVYSDKDTYDNSVSMGVYITNVALIATISAMGLAVVYSGITSSLQATRAFA